MNIAIYVPSWPPGSSANGIVTYAAQIVPVLRRSGHQVFVLTPHRTTTASDPYTIDLSTIGAQRSIMDRVKARVLGNDAAFDEAAERIDLAIQLLMDRYGLDVLEIEESFGWSLRIARSNRLPVVVRLHGPWFLNGTFDHDITPHSRARIELEGKAIGAATVITAPSHDVLEKVRARYGLALDDARVVHNPLDVDDGVGAWALNACHPYRLLYVGRFDRRKGGDLVLRAFADLAARHSDLRLTFIGPDNGIQEADGTRLSFDQFVKANLPRFCWDRIDFKGQMPHRELMSLRAAHFLTIGHPSDIASITA